jgi:hypothetical protein
MFRRTITGQRFPVIAGFGLLLVCGPARADTEDNKRSYDGDPKANAAGPPPSPDENKVSRLLKASGVPNDNGQIRWPLGLAILAAPGADDLCEEIDALYEEMARQAAAGPVNPTLAEEARQAVKNLRGLLLKEKTERFGMPLAVYQESERFLKKLDRAQRLLRAGKVTPAAQR